MNCKNLSRDNCLPPNCKYINGAKRKYCRNNTRNARNNNVRNNLTKKVLSKSVLSKPVLTKKVSRCKGLAKNNCFQPCRYVDTPKRQYCRISGKKNTEKVEKATNTISRFISKTISNRRLQRLASSPRASPRAPSPRAPSPRAPSPRVPSPRAPSPRAPSSRASITPYSRAPSPVHSSMPSLTSSPPTPRSRAPSPRAPSPRASSRASITPYSRVSSPVHSSMPSLTSSPPTPRSRVPSSRASSPTPSSRASSPSNQIEKVNKAKGIIGKFLYKNKDKIRANFLRTVCSDSGVCIAFGRESDKINDFFKFFQNFDYMINHNIIKSGANGTIVKIDYEREQYKSYAVLKKIKKASSDSLMYEYMVGRFFINNVYKKFPSFLQTYGFINHDDITTLKDQPIRNMNIADVNRGISLSCTNPNKILLLLENVSNPVTLAEHIASLSLPMLRLFITEELFKILFQVYYTLSVLRDVFTHYDLHLNNVLLYEPIVNGYIEYHYHYEGELISFNSRYIVKIIDYGRCYFSTARFTPRKIHQKICRLPECNKDGEVCGHDSGYKFFYTADADIKRNFYINKLTNNQSHDLRLLKSLNMEIPKNIKISPQIDKMLKFLLTKTIYKSNYGTPQILASGLPNNINNVNDAFDVIKRAVITLPISTVYDYLNKIGELNVFDNGREMDFRERV
jgi:hypothetical protein